jgi:hypothetical protein
VRVRLPDSPEAHRLSAAITWRVAQAPPSDEVRDWELRGKLPSLLIEAAREATAHGRVLDMDVWFREVVRPGEA